MTGAVLLTGIGPAAGATVALDGPVSLATVTGGAGRYAFPELPAGSYTVTATAASTAGGVPSVSVRVAAGDRAVAPDLVLTPVGTIHGTVTLAGLDPQPPVTVTLTGPSLAATVTASGAYGFGPLPLGDFVVAVTGPDTVEGCVSTAVHVGMGATAVPDLVLTPVGRVSGTVTLTGLDPQPPLTVTLTGPVEATALTDPAGRFTSGSLPPGEYTVSVVEPWSLEGSASTTVRVTMGTVAAPALTLTPFGRLEGAVVLAGLAPRAGLAVTIAGAGSAATSTDAAGRYAFGQIAPGAWVVSVDEPYSLQGSTSTTVHVAMGPNVAPDLTLTPTGRVSGRVVLTGAAPREGVPVTLVTAPAGALAAVASTDASGSYALGPVVVGDYAVRATVPSTAESTLAAAAHVSFGASAGPDLVFAPLGRIGGDVVLQGGGAAADAIVWLQGTNRAVRADGAGAFSLQGVPVGGYALSASRVGSATARVLVDVSYDTTTMVPALALAPPDPAAPLTGRLSGFASVVGMGRRGGITVSVDATPLSTVTAADGSWAIAVADGAWSLTLTDGVHVEHVPSAVALPGSDGFLLDGALYPIGELELQVAPRLTSRTVLARQLTTDGHYLLLDGAELRSASLDGGAIVRLATDVRAFTAPSSGTGTRSWVVVFAADGTASAVPAGGGAVVPLGDVDLVAFGPTGQTLVAHGAGGQLWYADLERGDVRAVARGWEAGSQPFAGRFTFADSTTGEVGTVEFATGRVVMLGAFDVCELRVLPNGAVLAKENGSGPCYGRVLAGPPGGPLAVVAPASASLFNFSNDVSPDGAWVVVTAFDLDARESRLVLASTSTGAVVRTHRGSSLFVGWSPSSTHLLWRLGSDLHLVRAADGASTLLATDPVNRGGSAERFSPDGAFVAFCTGTQLQVAETATGAPVAADSAELGCATPVAFSADSAFLIVRGAGVHSLSLANGGETTIAPSVMALQVSPDPPRVLFMAGDALGPAHEGVFSVPLSGAPTALLVPPGTNVGMPAAIHPETNTVVFQSPAGILFVPIDGGALQLLGPSGQTSRGPMFSPDGLTLTFLDGGGVLRSAALPAGAPVTLEREVSGFRLLQGGILVWKTDGSLSVGPAFGPLTLAAASPRSWGPAPGDRLVVVDEQGRLSIWTVPTGVSSVIANGVSGAWSQADRLVMTSDGILRAGLLDGGPFEPRVRVEPGAWRWEWLDAHHGLALRTDAPAPYRFQNGIYLVGVP